MAIDRRHFLAGTLAAAASVRIVPVMGAEGPDLFAATRKEPGGGYSAALFTLEDGDLRSVELPGRGHDVAVRPGGRECVAFARRPGRFAVAIPTDGKRPPVWFKSAPGRHFYGHGVFSPDGRLLYSTENNYAEGVGSIGIRDATDGYTLIGEFPAHGIGPHDIALLSDGRTMVIANGGIRTHPDYPRIDLNPTAMKPVLAYVDMETGDLLERHTLKAELRQLSIRHLAVAAGDTVVFGCQYRGPKTDEPPLVGVHKRGGELQLFRATGEVQPMMRNYIGSVAADRSGEIVATSAPRGDIVCYWDVTGMRFLGHASMADGCGLAATRHRGEFLLTSGEGWLARGHAGDAGPGAKKTARRVHWDNHAALLNAPRGA